MKIDGICNDRHDIFTTTVIRDARFIFDVYCGKWNLIVYMGMDVASVQIPQVIYNALNNSMLVALPSFIFAGQVIIKSGIGTLALKRLINGLGIYQAG